MIHGKRPRGASKACSELPPPERSAYHVEEGVESEGGEGGVGRRGGNGPRPVAEPGVEHLGGAKQRLAGEGHQQPEHLSAKKGSRQPTIAARARAAWTALLSQRRTSTRLRSKLLLRTTTPSSMPPTPGAHTAPGCRTSQQTNGADAKPKKNI